MIQHAKPAARREDLTRSLREDALRTLISSIAAISLVLFIVGLLVLDAEQTFTSVPLVVSTLLLACCWSANELCKRGWYYWGAALFLCGLVGAISITIPNHRLSQNPFIFFTPLVVITAGLLIRPSFGFVAAICAGLLLAASAMMLGYTQELLGFHFLAAMGLSLLSALIGWRAALTFVTAVEWAMDSYHKVERREQQLFESEKRLQSALLDKDFLNSQLMQSNQELERARAAAEDANRLKTQFVTNMSHELRTPLNAIIGFSYILKQQLKGPINQDQEDYIQRIYDSGEHLLRLLNDILDNAKLEAGRLDMHCSPTLLEPIIHEAMLTATSLLRDKPVELRQAIVPDLPPIFGDRLRIAQVLLNLLSNAVKFTEQGSITLRAYAVPVGSQNGAIGNGLANKCRWQVIVEVIDTGIGIAPEHLLLIFEEYRQADATLSRQYGGTGLGLPISRRLVELHGGELTVSSQPGEGSTFRFTLPVATTEQLQAVPIAQEL